MIRLTDIDGRDALVAPGCVMAVREQRPNHHGLRSIVFLVTGERIEARESVRDIEAAILRSMSGPETRQGDDR